MKTRYPDNTHGHISRTQGLYSYHGWGSVCAAQGTLYAACSAFRMHHICPFGKNALYRSTDGGVTWSSPVVVNDTALDDRDAGIVSLGGSRLLVSWFVHPAAVYLNHYFKDFVCCSPEDHILRAQLDYWAENNMDPALGGSFVRVSEDGGMTWGETVRVPVSSPHGPTLLSDGTLMYLGKEMYSSEIPSGALAVFTSDGTAKHWEPLAFLDPPDGLTLENCHEPHMIELQSGRLLGAVRVENRTEKLFSVYTCFSDDAGKTWSKLVPTGIEGSPPHLLLHSSGAVLLSVGRRKEPFGERVYVSVDGGVSFTEEYILRDDGKNKDLGYPCTAELFDGSLVTVYYQGAPEDKNPSFQFTKWRL